MELIHNYLDNAARVYPLKKAIITKANSLTYSELRVSSIQSANFLLEYGVKQGDRVLIYLPNSIILVSLLFGISRIGAIAVIVNEKTSKDNLNFIIDDCKPKILISNKEDVVQTNSIHQILVNNLIEDLENYSKESIPFKINVNTNDKVLLIYTSGSTGKPKAIVTAHKNVIFCTQEISQELGIRNTDIIGNFLPLSFDYGLYQVFISFHTQATLALGDYTISGVELMKYLRKWTVSVFPSTPHLTSGFINMLKRSKYPTYIRTITNTGEKLSNNLIDDIKLLIPNCNIYLMYGLTECKRVSILNPLDLNKKPGSVGKPLKGVTCYIVDEKNNILEKGNVGQLVVMGPNVMQGYWNNEQSNFKKLKNGNRVLYTGDLFKMDDEGYLYYVGRMDSLYKQNGFRISSIEIEDYTTNLGLAEIAILIPSEEYYQYSTLYVKSKLNSKSIKFELAKYLEYYKIPREIINLNDFPVNINGKIDKNKLKKMRMERRNVRL